MMGCYTNDAGKTISHCSRKILRLESKLIEYGLGEILIEPNMYKVCGAKIWLDALVDTGNIVIMDILPKELDVLS